MRCSVPGCEGVGTHIEASCTTRTTITARYECKQVEVAHRYYCPTHSPDSAIPVGADIRPGMGAGTMIRCTPHTYNDPGDVGSVPGSDQNPQEALMSTNASATPALSSHPHGGA